MPETAQDVSRSCLGFFQQAMTKTEPAKPEVEKKLGVLLISHGSPSPEWNASQIQLRENVQNALRTTSGCTDLDVHWAWLEFADPDIAAAMDEMEKSGLYSRVIAVPVFISVSSHSERDIPNCLNTRFIPLRDDELRRYMGNLPVTYCSPMDSGRTDVLPGMILDNAKKLIETSEQKDTAVITVSHGDGCEHFWGHLHGRIANTIAEVFPDLNVNTHCYIQTLRKPWVQKRLFDLIADCIDNKKCKNVVILSCFNGTGGSMFLSRLESMYLAQLPIAAAAAKKAVENNDKDCPMRRLLPDDFQAITNKGESDYPKTLKERFPTIQISGDEPWMADKRVVEWAVDMIQSCVTCITGQDEGEDPADQPPFNPPFTLTRDLGEDEAVMMAPPLKSSKGKGKSAPAPVAEGGKSAEACPVQVAETQGGKGLAEPQGGKGMAK